MKTVVIISGGVHPFHSGHYSLYNEANKKFPDADVYVAATNDTSARPFPFVIKQKLAQLAGVPENRFVQVRSPFRAEEITRNYDPNDTVLIFVRSEKDMNTSPKPGGTKKDGSPSYLQPLNKDLKPMNQHAYMTYLPTIEFGPGITSASEIRAAWPQLNEKRKTALVMSLYPRTQTNPALAQTVVKMLDTAIGAQGVAENQPNQAGIGSKTSVMANTQPQTTTAATTNVAKPSVGTVQTTQPTQTAAATTPAAATTSMSTPPDANVTNLARRLGVDPKRLQGELQNMQEDYLDEKRH
jgi:hypothetical protein